jgi:hypothetical protein
MVIYSGYVMKLMEPTRIGAQQGSKPKLTLMPFWFEGSIKRLACTDGQKISAIYIDYGKTAIEPFMLEAHQGFQATIPHHIASVISKSREAYFYLENLVLFAINWDAFMTALTNPLALYHGTPWRNDFFQSYAVVEQPADPLDFWLPRKKPDEYET